MGALHAQQTFPKASQLKKFKNKILALINKI